MNRVSTLAFVLLTLLAVPAAAEVGDPHSFGRAMKWRGGFLESEGIVLRAECSSSPPEPVHCVQLLPAPATTEFEVGDLGTIVLPGNSASARSLLCEVVSPYAVYSVFNPDPQLASHARVFAAATLRVESPVLQDPQLINPLTGQPFNGFLVVTLPGAHHFNQMLGPQQSALKHDQERSYFCGGGFVSKARLMSRYGLSAAQANAFFASDITLRLGIKGSARLLADFGQFIFNIRILSD
jgi:hypothetical protein